MTTSAYTALELAQQIASGERSAVEITQAALEAISAGDEAVGAFLCHTPDLALKTAQTVDQKRSQGQPLHPLAGVPIGVKDNLNVTGYPTTCASRILAGYVSPYNATVTERLLAAGLPIVGKTNLDEFAMGSSTENSAYQLTRNPWDLTRVPGGSSGGSAACVAAGWVPLSLGSDTGGSVRQPAALCGLVGLKPTYGLVSRYGLVAYASSLDQVSPFARTVADLAAILELIAGPDPMDATTLKSVETLGYLKAVQTPLEQTYNAQNPLRVGVIAELSGEGMQAEVQTAFAQSLKILQGLGAQVETVSIEGIGAALAAYYLVAPAEASSNLARFDGIRYGLRTQEKVDNVYDLFQKTRGEGFGPEVKRRIMLGTFALSAGYYDAYYGKAQKARHLLNQAFSKAFERFDVLVCPTSPSTAFAFGSKTNDPVSMYLSDIATIPVNLAGIPALSQPCGFDEEGLPIGLQILGPKLSEGKLLQLAAAFEQATGYSNLLPQAKTVAV